MATILFVDDYGAVSSINPTDDLVSIDYREERSATFGYAPYTECIKCHKLVLATSMVHDNCNVCINCGK